MSDLADCLSGLSAEQWDSPSLCAAWRIRDVLAHLVAGAQGAFGAGAIVMGMLRHGLNFTRWVAADGRARGAQDPALLVAALQSAATDRARTSAGESVAGLMHVLIHGQDMCRPLGISRVLPASHLVVVANIAVEDRHRFGAKKRIAGLTLTATDVDWSHGEGPEVTGRAEALVMMMAGRRVALDDLSGEGMAILLTRR